MGMAKKKRYRPIKPPKKPNHAYTQLWRLVDGGVRDAFRMHPNYIPPSEKEWIVRQSIAKRVTGTIEGYIEELCGLSARGRSSKSAGGCKG